MHQSSTLDIGLDVHQDAIAVVSVAQGHDAELIYFDTIGTRQAAMAHLGRTLHPKAPHLVLVDEAGPCGD